jgi:hypothetical protein
MTPNKSMNTEPTVEECLRELRDMFPDAKFITLSGDYVNRWSGEQTMSTRVQIASSWRDGQGGGFFNAPTLSEVMAAVRQRHEENKQ